MLNMLLSFVGYLLAGAVVGLIIMQVIPRLFGKPGSYYDKQDK